MCVHLFDFCNLEGAASSFSFHLRKGPDKNDSTERQRTCWNVKKVLTFLLSLLTSDWLKQQKLTKPHKAVHIFILTFQPSSIYLVSV